MLAEYKAMLKKEEKLKSKLSDLIHSREAQAVIEVVDGEAGRSRFMTKIARLFTLKIWKQSIERSPKKDDKIKYD